MANPEMGAIESIDEAAQLLTDSREPEGQPETEEQPPEQANR